LAISTGDDLDRTTSGRFVRNLALSLSGGALLTLLGATAAHADSVNDAGTQSDGTGAARSGDATAVGNQSGTNSTQTVTVSGNLGVIQVINQQANVSNVGASVANTGGNIAIGNSSNNTAAGTQTGNGGLGPASNTGTAGNASNGSAAISTGNASSIGNSSNTTINQVANGSAHGLLGGILVINQDATVTNSGVALANSGGNFANGNDSDNDSSLLQDANTAAGLAANSGKATNSSDGKATINTGNASATGNKSDTQIFQSATGSAGGALGGLVVIDQNAFVVNAGAAVANTGGNIATGNTSDNTADLDQTLNSGGAPDPIGVASNNGEASNGSNGTAGITTGNASAVGNDSQTKVTQNATSDITGAGGGAVISQNSNVLNIGFAAANSGLNAAVGNTSQNDATTTQDTPSTGATGIGVVGQFGMASSDSDGTGLVHTGSASANGSISKTDVSQTSDAKGGAFNLITPVQGVQNIGVGVSNSGLNAAVGNTSDSESTVDQTATLPAGGTIGVGVGGNFGLAHNSSDGTADIRTGNASATGNSSSTTISQAIDPTGLLVPTQVTNVTNLGAAVANSGGNIAVGNVSDNDSTITQAGEVDADTLLVGTLVQSNNGEASNTSDGTARIATGNASATGNESRTDIRQVNDANIDGMGFVVNTQVSAVANAGFGAANSGLNVAVGNVSQNESDATQTMVVGASPGADTINAGILAASNNGTASNASDGTASITTGDASGVGNRSATSLTQIADGDVSGLGGSINTQAAVVLNAGVGIGNSGLNGAIGNASGNDVELVQTNDVGTGAGDDTVTAGLLTASNSGTASNSSDGKATVSTGKAEGTGNASSTQLTQETNGDVSGIGIALNTQVAGVANVGLGLANSGGNLALGNVSQNGVDGDPALVQSAAVLGGPGDDTLLAAQVISSNQGEATNASDGSATVRTGGAQAQGNVSSTNILQDPNSNVDGLGLVIGTQVAGVLNAGAGVANSGLNLAVGNASGTVDQGLGIGAPNTADVDQTAAVATGGGDDSLTAVTALASNSGNASNRSDGSALVQTGGALATGNASATNVEQRQSGTVTGMGTVIGTQVGGVANVGLGVANSGLNAAVGNLSQNTATLTGDGGAQSATLLSGPGADTATILGTAGASNSGEASNSSDGDACVCTGNAVASGNVSSTTLIQDLDLDTTDGGLVLLTEAGGVLNAGLGVANSGLNLAIGNFSDNTATTIQDADIDDALPFGGIFGDQIASNGGGARNTSNGVGKVGSGNASGTGNQSSTNFVQAAAASGPLSIATLTGGTANVGAGIANAGLNLGIGNLSVNDATLEQDAEGAGIVSNQGEATNDSDGTAIIGNPDCDVPTETPGTPGKPGAPGLPKTGGALEVEAAVALMLLLLGFGLKRKGSALA
jgi:hypothetical protein